MAFEFTPEITEGLYQKMARRRSEQGASDVGTARGEALARGLTGDPFEASAVGAARTGTANALSDLDADLAYRIAGLQREERLGKEGQQFQAGEAEKNRAFQERLQRLGFDFQSDQANTAARRDMQSGIVKGLFGLGAAGFGGFMGRK